MANTGLSRTITTSGNRKTFTFSAWVKRSKLGVQQMLMSAMTSSGGIFYTRLFFTDSDTLHFMNYPDGYNIRTWIITNQVFRDTNAWYHIVVASDSTQATASNRTKIYVNGEQITSFSEETQPSQNRDYYWNYTGTSPMYIGQREGNNDYFDGSMSHIHFIDGTAYDASYFGSQDVLTGEWKINVNPNVQYGTYGFFILKDGNSVTDQSPNTNNFTVAGGTLTKTEDNPSNVFATMNPLDQNGGMTFSNGNLSVASTSASWRSTRGTIGVTQGKWYYEVKAINSGGANLDMMVGWGDFEIAIPSEFSSSNLALTYTAGSGNKQLNGVNTSYGATYNVGDIIGVAFDADNLTVEFFKNGTSQGSISTGWSSGITWTPIISLYGRYNNTKASYNFGNGFFSTTAVSSNSGNGYSATGNLGIFQYQPPTNYTALCTKGLNL